MNNKKGFSLIEMLVAMVIVAIVSAGFFAFTISSINYRAKIMRINTAYTMADDMMNKIFAQNQQAIRTARYNATTLQPETCTGTPINDNTILNNIDYTQQIGTGNDGTVYYADWSIYAMSCANITDDIDQKVFLVVRWIEPGGIQKHIITSSDFTYKKPG